MIFRINWFHQGIILKGLINLEKKNIRNVWDILGLYKSFSLSWSFLILGDDIRGLLQAAGASIIPLDIDRWTCLRKSSRPRERHVRWFTSWDPGTCHTGRHSNLLPSFPASLSISPFLLPFLFVFVPPFSFPVEQINDA